MPDITVKLKICEACGGLWYRAVGDASVYCAACQVKLKQFPPPTTESVELGPHNLNRVVDLEILALKLFHAHYF